MADAKDSFKKKLIGEIVAVVLGLIVAFTPPVNDKLTAESMIVLGVLIWAVVNWITQAIPDFMAAILMCTFWTAFNAVPFATAFNGYSSSTFWTLIGAFGLGSAVSKSGLLKRISLYMLKFFPPTFRGQVLAMLGAGTIIAPLIPSNTAKCAIASPIAMGIADQLGFETQSKGRSGIFAAMFTGFGITSPIFVSASFLGYTMLGALPDGYKTFPWLSWFLNMIPWGIVILVGSYLFITRFYKPEGSHERIPADHIKKQLEEIGPMTRNEKISAIVLFGCLVFWIGETTFGVPAVISTLIGFGVLLSLNVVDHTDFVSKMMWPLLFFIGAIMSLGVVLQEVGVGRFLGDVVKPIMGAIGGNPYLLIAGSAILVYALRMLIPMSASLTVFTIVLSPFALAANIHPWVIGIVVYTATIVWYLSHMYPMYTACSGMSGISRKDTVSHCVAYMLLNLAALLISVPFWRMSGLIG